MKESGYLPPNGVRQTMETSLTPSPSPLLAAPRLIPLPHGAGCTDTRSLPTKPCLLFTVLITPPCPRGTGTRTAAAALKKALSVF